jgi:hypothetical protein
MRGHASHHPDVIPAKAGVQLRSDRKGIDSLDSTPRHKKHGLLHRRLLAMTHWQDVIASEAWQSISTPLPTEPQPELSVSLRSGAGNCLTEPGIVCFPVAPRLKLSTLFDSSDGEALRGPRRSFGGP